MFRCQLKTVSRSTGRTATGAAAYRSASKIEDERTGRKHDYTRKAGVIDSGLVGPITDREKLWNAAESSENRKNSLVARELIISLPHEATPKQRRQVIESMSVWLRYEYDVAVDWAIHEPNKRGDDRNIHAHVMFTTREVNQAGEFGEKTRSLDKPKTTGREQTKRMRKKCSELCQAIAKNPEDWDHRSYAERGIDKTPGPKLGPAATGFERRTGKKSEVRKRAETKVENRLGNQKKKIDYFNDRDDQEKTRLDEESNEPTPEAPTPPGRLASLWPPTKSAYEKQLKKFSRLARAYETRKKRIKHQLRDIEERMKKRLKLRNRVVSQINEIHFEKNPRKIKVRALEGSIDVEESVEVKAPKKRSRRI